MRSALDDAGFATMQRAPVSYFRLGAFKRLFPTGVLVALDRALQRWGPLYAPSVFTQNRAVGDGPDHVGDPLRFLCPRCGAEVADEGAALVCVKEGTRWAKRNGIYDFKEAAE